MTVLIPTKSISIISAEDQPFHDPEADAALFDAIQQNLADHVELIELDVEINDPAFSEACTKALLANIEKSKS